MLKADARRPSFFKLFDYLMYPNMQQQHIEKWAVLSKYMAVFEDDLLSWPDKARLCQINPLFYLPKESNNIEKKEDKHTRNINLYRM